MRIPKEQTFINWNDILGPSSTSLMADFDSAVAPREASFCGSTIWELGSSSNSLSDSRAALKMNKQI